MSDPQRVTKPEDRSGSSWMWIVIAAAYVLLIFFVSSRPYLQPPWPEFAMKDKLAHASEYGILGALLMRILAGRAVRSAVVSFMLVLAIVATIAAADEMFQGTVPGRQKDVTDWMADITGASAGAGVALTLLRRRVTKGADV